MENRNPTNPIFGSPLRRMSVDARRINLRSYGIEFLLLSFEQGPCRLPLEDGRYTLGVGAVTWVEWADSR